MKRILLGIVLMLILNQTFAKEDDTQKIKDEINAILNTWHKAAATADEKTYFDILASHSIYIGTDSKERWTKAEFQNWAKPYFQRKSAWNYAPVNRNLFFSEDKSLAWFDEELDSKDLWTCRGSGVLQKIDGSWKIVNYILSFTIPNETVKTIKPIIQDVFIKTPNDLNLKYGFLSLGAIPYAQIFIDGKEIGYTPKMNFRISIGKHEIVFKNPEFPEIKRTVVVKEKDEKEILVNMETGK